MFKNISLTVDSNSNTLVEHITITTNESWYLAQLVYLQVFRRKPLGRLNFNNSDIEVVRLRNRVDCG
jgi:hypothetical protein